MRTFSTKLSALLSIVLIVLLAFVAIAVAAGTVVVIADRIAMSRADVVITEAGFGADMGAERFFDVKCRAEGLVPDLAVVVVTVRAMKAHSGRYDIRPGKDLPPALLAASRSGLVILGMTSRTVTPFEAPA